MLEQECLIKITTPTTITIVGGSGSGKTFFTKRLLENAKFVFDVAPKCIVYCYVVWQDVYTDMQHSVPNILFYEGLPTREELYTWADESQKHMMLVLDDLMMEMCNSELMLKVYSTLSHHLGITCISLQQSLYPKGMCSRTMSLNTHLFVLMANARSAHE
jgi:Ni2+-binding GTPase involved in maturation of urease and hydrogenase